MNKHHGRCINIRAISVLNSDPDVDRPMAMRVFTLGSPGPARYPAAAAPASLPAIRADQELPKSCAQAHSVTGLAVSGAPLGRMKADPDDGAPPIGDRGIRGTRRQGCPIPSRAATALIAPPGTPGPPSPAARRSRSCSSAGASPAWTAPGCRRTARASRRAAARPCHRWDPPRRPSRRPGRDLQVRVDPALAARPDVLRDQVRQPSALRRGHHRHQAGLRHEIRVIERCTRLREAMQQSHLSGALSS